MVTLLKNFMVRFAGLSRLAGPILDKELRVSSRRRRNYLLRSAYIVIMTLFLSLVWVEEVPPASPGVWQASRMAQAGQVIVMFIVWFQFIAAQAVAAVLLSGAISDEIYHQTLGLLMTTPINSMQIVVGKLLSKLLQLMLLLAVAVPLLAIVRVFGGIPWRYVIAALSLTFTTALFAGSVSLFLSVFIKRSYVVVVRTAFVIGFLFLVLPLLLGLLLLPGSRLDERTFMTVLSFTNPYIMLGFVTGNMVSGMMAGGLRLIWFGWGLHCLLMLGVSGGLLLISTLFVRKAALHQATGQPVFARESKKRRVPTAIAHAPARRVTGPAVLWKEWRAPLLGKRKSARIVTVAGTLMLLLVTYTLCARAHVLDEASVHVMFMIVFTGAGIIMTLTVPAAVIAAEKETRTWPLLMTTTLSDWHIVVGKFGGALRRTLLIWLLPLGHLLVFGLGDLIHPVALLHMPLITLSVVLLLCCSGLYFSSRFKHATTAVIANLVFAVLVWAILPLAMVMITELDSVRRSAYHKTCRDVAEAYFDANPFVQAGAITAGATNPRGRLEYNWSNSQLKGVGGTTAWLILTLLAYVFFGWLFLWRTKVRLRRRPV